MDVFQIKKEDDKPLKLTVKNYENKTNKREPFYQNKNNKIKHYAICPACKNPIIIVNLYVDKTLDENERKMPFHAKHCKYDVDDLAKYCEESYNTCPLAKPSAFGGTAKVRSKKKRNEIVSLIKNYPVALYNEIRGITGIDFSESTFSNMITNFIESEGYYYKYINKYNLPYGFLNMQKSIRIYKNKLFYSSFRNELIQCIDKSNYFKFTYDKIMPKFKDGFYEIELYLSDHKIHSDLESETIDIVIIEKHKDVITEVFRKTLTLNLEKYINIIDKQRRINALTTNIELSEDYFDSYIKK